ncbi:MAG TPA: iron-sulfur cluster-binding domain-containing protein, partial [Microthrixaceae bacterium]|nr:iron-sulfur cluster-binding domain-containing protein [Microthrixaceae bacterium]HNJ69637.1 iron-sulfur cluster-binding domain-containing protein [Microthrixaceae bacterium]
LLTITVQQVPDGIVSNHLVQRIRPGDVVHLDGPEGDFTLDPDPAPTTGADHPPTAPGRPLLFITGGSGITPVIGMLRALDAGADTAPDATLDDVVVVHHAPTDRESLFTDELDAMARRNRGLRVVHVRTGAGAPPPEMELNAGRLDDLCPDWRDREAWTCGPRPMVEAVESLWSGPDHATTRALHVERFTPSIPDGLPEVEGTLTFRAAGVSVPSDGTRTVLDAAEDAGLSPLAGCRMGVCRRCVVPLHSGTVVDRRDGRIECEPGAHVQICVTAAVGDVEIEI